MTSAIDQRRGPVEAGLIDQGLPVGVLDLAEQRWRRAQTMLGGATAGAWSAPARERLVELLTAPLRLEPSWPPPAAPIAAGPGWVHAELIDDDLAVFEALVDSHGHRGPEALASACQELRLPVSPYRSAGGQPVGSVEPVDSVEVFDPVELSGAVVIDLSTHWAGPLATKLLAEAGATVVKVDPDCRPDGFRQRHRLYQHLNGTKQIVDLDLRAPSDRQRFEQLLTGADLLVESFSRRVMGNLGYDRASLAVLAPGLSMLSVKAFPAGSPEADWLAFGPGVHAASGLATTGPDRVPRPAPVAYADLLAGLSLFNQALTFLAEPGVGGQAEISLLSAIQPLLTGGPETEDGDGSGSGSGSGRS